MREIKFRAVHTISGEWVYGGGVIIQENEGVMLSGDTLRELIVHSIKPETVGQYTGFSDDNGLMVYEGDIVDVYDMYRPCDEEDQPGHGEEERHCACRCICMQKVKWAEGYYCDEDTGEFCPSLGSEEISLIIKGNVTDNPELLK